MTYHLKRRHMFGDLKLEFRDASGKLLSSVPGGKRRGINRVEWPMRAPPPRMPAGAGLIPNIFALLGPRVPPGEYGVTMIKGKETYASKVILAPDPRTKYSDADRKLQQETVWQLYRLLERLTYLVDSVVDLRDQARGRAEKLAASDALRKSLTGLADELERQRTALVSSKQGEGISGEEKLREELGTLYGNVNGFEGRPTVSQINRMAVLGKDLDAVFAKFEATANKGTTAFARALTTQKLDPMRRLSEEEWNARFQKK